MKGLTTNWKIKLISLALAWGVWFLIRQHIEDRGTTPEAPPVAIKTEGEI